MKDKVISILFVSTIFLLFLLSFFIKDNEISYFERRKLAQFPQKYDANFTEKLDNYLLDQFPFRNQFITVNSNLTRGLLGIKDVNGVYVIGNNIYEKLYPMKETECYNFCKKINSIIENELSNSNIYYSIIPDKSYFLEEDKYLKLNYSSLYKLLNENIKAKYINIKDILTIDDYYRTDIHWRQEKIQKVANKLMQEMNNPFRDINYEIKKYNHFLGASYAKAGTNIPPDELIFLYNPIFKNVVVEHLEYGEKHVYDIPKLEGIDAYDVFLSGASSYIKIKNNEVKNDSELIVFRDSFASNLLPLIIPYYHEITVIDLRYITFDIVKEKTDFNEKDVLFLYSTQIINNSSILKIK